STLDHAHVDNLMVEIPGDAHQYLDQVGHRTAGGADRGHEQHGVPGGLVDLNAVPVHQVTALEHVPVDSGGADIDRDPGRIKHELIGVPRLDHVLQSGSQRLADP